MKLFRNLRRRRQVRDNLTRATEVQVPKVTRPVWPHLVK